MDPKGQQQSTKRSDQDTDILEPSRHAEKYALTMVKPSGMLVAMPHTDANKLTRAETGGGGGAGDKNVYILVWGGAAAWILKGARVSPTG